MLRVGPSVVLRGARAFGRGILQQRGLQMEAIRVSAFGDANQLEFVQDAPIPEVAPGMAVVKVLAAGINPVDTYIRSGAYFRLPPLPFTPGQDGAGIVTKVGESVTKLAIGDRVFISGTDLVHGTYAQYCLSEEADLHSLPENVDFKCGAALGVPYRTAYRALFIQSSISKGDRLLIHGASGSVGLACVQMARDAGAFVVGTAGSKEGLDIVKSNGADIVLNHREEGHLDDLLRACPEGVDVIVEMLANVNLGDDLTLLRQGGKVVVVGSRGPVEIDPRYLLVKEASITGVNSFQFTPEQTAACISYLEQRLSSGVLKPHIGSEFALEGAKYAQEQIMHNAGAQGDIILKPWKETDW